MGAVQAVRTVRGAASPPPPPRLHRHVCRPTMQLPWPWVQPPGGLCSRQIPSLHPQSSRPPTSLSRTPSAPAGPKPSGYSSRVRYWTRARPFPAGAPPGRPPRCPPVSPRVPCSPRCPPVPPCPLGLSPLVPPPHPYSLPAVPLYSRVPGMSPRCVPPARPVSPPRVSPPPRAPAELWDRRAQEVAGRRGRGRRAAGRAGRDGGRGRRAPHSLRPDAGPGAPRAGAQRPERPGGDAEAERATSRWRRLQVSGAAPEVGPPPGPPPEVGAPSTAAPGRP
ncbi:basic proline-rich protein-like [Balaenoptera musculus]|uniref:Basic proline-rich protein-like n=1 Tax=Balaenoptera musculus TaxID=9771 RepID=A0A8B8X7K7_BALMU|nr:basic proline-rich protein-like [Balaenoptera musculus]